jgi:hypothetical protein
MRVGERQGIDNFTNYPHGLGNGQLPFFLDPFPERVALDVGHHVVEETVCFTRVMQRKDVRMSEVGRNLDLTQKPLRAQRGGKIGTQHLHRYLPVMPYILSQVDGGHASVTDLTFDPVAAGQRSSQILETV